MTALHPVAHAANGLDAAAAGPQLGAQGADVYIHGAGLPQIIGAPYPVQQLAPGEDLAGALQKDMEQLILLQGEADLLPVGKNRVGPGPVVIGFSSIPPQRSAPVSLGPALRSTARTLDTISIMPKGLAR